jgi:4-deoxy-L-threo-5-hexosulose-uronate ketol-isomerase
MDLHRTASFSETETLTTKQLRKHFMLSDLFRPGESTLVYTDLDRGVVGGICPDREPIRLNASKQLKAAYFFERREAGVLNIGDVPAIINVDGEAFTLMPEECLYIGQGSESVTFAADDSDARATLYFVSFPAHARYPTRKAGLDEAKKVHLGDGGGANERIIHQYIHPEGVQSCQLVMGLTRIMPGSVWNTMPAHTHERRCELYLYFDVDEKDAIFHFMGAPSSTRHLVARNQDVVLSPPWSIHAGCGTSAYRFAWAMGGENQRFDDMDPAAIKELL